MKYLVPLKDMNISQIHRFGGKNASLGEMLQNLSKMGIKVPDGYATTVDAYHQFLTQNNLTKKINHVLSGINITNVNQLHKASTQIRHWIINASLLPEFEEEVLAAYKKIKKGRWRSAPLPH